MEEYSLEVKRILGVIGRSECFCEKSVLECMESGYSEDECVECLLDAEEDVDMDEEEWP